MKIKNRQIIKHMIVAHALTSKPVTIVNGVYMDALNVEETLIDSNANELVALLIKADNYLDLVQANLNVKKNSKGVINFVTTYRPYVTDITEMCLSCNEELFKSDTLDTFFDKELVDYRLLIHEFMELNSEHHAILTNELSNIDNLDDVIESIRETNSIEDESTIVNDEIIWESDSLQLKKLNSYTAVREFILNKIEMLSNNVKFIIRSYELNNDEMGTAATMIKIYRNMKEFLEERL